MENDSDVRMIYPAHIRQDGTVQTVAEHCRSTAALAGEKLRAAGLYSTAYLAGLLHDCGKESELFKDYITAVTAGKDPKTRVIHTFTGVIFILERYHRGDAMSYLTSELIAYAIGAHHGQYDLLSPDGEGGFAHRLNADREGLKYDGAVASFLSDCADISELDALFAAAKAEISAVYGKLLSISNISDEMYFMLGQLARLLLSAVIDGDRRDTAFFCSGMPTPVPGEERADGLWERTLRMVEAKLSEYKADTPINAARSEFSDRCAAFAVNPPGIYTLNLPTGGGKTLCSLRYALKHAAIYGKKRVIFTVPLLSVLEQNADVIRKFVGNDAIITEHHSNAVRPKADGSELLDPYELAVQTWDSPIIITTLVQLLQTLFSGKTQPVRRMSALCDSVVVIDEVQSLPKKTVKLFNAACNLLSRLCNTTFVLCSATQPEFDAVRLPLRYAENREIVPGNGDIFNVFKRTEIKTNFTKYGMSIEELADFSLSLLNGASSLLVVCNTKASAEKLYRQLTANAESGEVLFISAAMCTAHRRDRFSLIKRLLEGKNREKPLICVSTQVLEAGVDLSFERVVRVLAGVDSIAQAAGRCNRGGEFGYICPVYTVKLRADCEELKMLREIKAAQRAAESVLREAPDGADVLSEEFVSKYYRTLFSDPEVSGSFDYPHKFYGGDTKKLFELLAVNKTCMSGKPDGYLLHQAFKTAGGAFEVFDGATDDVVVPYDERARELIADIESEKGSYDVKYLSALSQRAKLYTVGLFRYQADKLSELGLLHKCRDGRFLALDPLAYCDETGLKSDFTYNY